MWKFSVLLICLSGYCSAGPVGQKRNMPIVQHRNYNSPMSELEPVANEDPHEMMIMSSLTLPSNATSIRADITDGFSCENKTYGYYADVDNDCQIFHVCLPVTYADGKENTFRWSFICPEDTIFSQDSFTCMRPDDMTITCEESYQYYELNRNFGMIDSNADKETSNEAATGVTAESNESNMEAEHEAAPVKPVVQEEEQQSRPVNVPKPSRRKPSVSYANQRKPVNSYPLRKMPQDTDQSPATDSSANPTVQNDIESMKPLEKEEELKPVINKFSRRPINSFIKDNAHQSSTDQVLSVSNENSHPVEEEKTKPLEKEEELKPVINKFSRRPINSFIKDATPQSSTDQVLSVSNENSHPVEEEETKPAVHKFSRRPVTALNNPIRDKIQNANTKPANVMPTRTDLLNQLRKRPNIFNKKPVEQTDEEKPVEQAKVEFPHEQQNFSPLATDMSNSNSETQVADIETEASENKHVLVQSQETNEISQNAGATNNMSEEPVQVLEAFEEIPAVISEVVEAPSAEEEEEMHNEQTVIIAHEKSDNVEEPQIIEAVQSAEEDDEAQAIIKMPTSEETQSVDDSETVKETKTAEVTHDIPSLKDSTEDIQNSEKTKTIEQPPNNQAAEEAQNAKEHETAGEKETFEYHQISEEPHTVEVTQNVQNVETETAFTAEEMQHVQEHQADEEMLNVDHHQAVEEPDVAENTGSIPEPEAAEEMQNIDDHKVAEMPHTAEDTQDVQEHQATGEIQHDHQVAEESETPEETQITQETKTHEESQVPEEVATIEEVSNAEEVSAADEVLAVEKDTSLDNMEAEEETQTLTENISDIVDPEKTADTQEYAIGESPTNEESSSLQINIASDHTAEDTLEEGEKLNEVQTQNTEDFPVVNESFTPAEEVLLVEEPNPVIHQIQELSNPMESEESKLNTEYDESPKVFNSLDSDSIEEHDVLKHHSEASDNMSAAQTIEQMESEKPAEAPESMPATDEMTQSQSLVQQMYEDMNMKKQSLKGLKPVDPVMAQEAEQLIADFINTLKKNDFTNETPGVAMEHHSDETYGQAEAASSSMTDMQDEENSVNDSENMEESERLEIPEKQEENQAEEIQEMDDSKQETVPENETTQDSFALKLLETPSMGNMEESQQSIESADEAMHLPQDMYQIPVKVITVPAEEVEHNEDQSPESEIKSSEITDKAEESPHKDETPAMHMAGNKPLSIDDIVELVKERLDQMPKNEMKMDPMQLEHVLSEAQEDKIVEDAPQADEQHPISQSVEEAVMPIYQRVAEPLQIEADEPSEALKQSLSAAEQTQALDDVSEVREKAKTNRSYKKKFDSRKRRFLFKADSS